MRARRFTHGELSLLPKVGLPQEMSPGTFELTWEGRALLGEKPQRPPKPEPFRAWLARMHLLTALVAVGCGGAACGGEADRESAGGDATKAMPEVARSVECSYLARSTITRERVLLSARAEELSDGWASATFELSVVAGSELQTDEQVGDGGARYVHIDGPGPRLSARFDDVPTLGSVALSLDFDANTFSMALNGDVFRTLSFADCEVSP